MSNQERTPTQSPEKKSKKTGGGIRKVYSTKDTTALGVSAIQCGVVATHRCVVNWLCKWCCWRYRCRRCFPSRPKLSFYDTVMAKNLQKTTLNPQVLHKGNSPEVYKVLWRQTLPKGGCYNQIASWVIMGPRTSSALSGIQSGFGTDKETIPVRRWGRASCWPRRCRPRVERPVCS